MNLKGKVGNEKVKYQGSHGYLEVNKTFESEQFTQTTLVKKFLNFNRRIGFRLTSLHKIEI